MPEKKHYMILSLLFIVLISLPTFQMLTRLVPEKKLEGSWYGQKLPELTWPLWYHSEYQVSLNRYVEEQYGFRTFCTRLYNQAEYSLFRQPHAKGVVLGRDGYLYEEWFIESYFGRNYIGDEQVMLKTRWLRQVRKYFTRKGKELMVFIAPGKADYFPEFIPTRLRDSIGKTNYSELSASFLKARIPVLDLNRLFKIMKDTVPCPLFPKNGTHWSQYGARLATDTLSGFISAMIQRPLPDIRLENFHLTNQILSPDDDLEKLLNLIFPLTDDPLCYPDVVKGDPSGFDLPSALIIGDSYFWQMYNIGLMNLIFKDLQFWYYNSTIYPDSYITLRKADEVPLHEGLDFADLIILVVNPANIQDIGWGFIDRVMNQEMQPAWQKEYDKMVKEYIQAIHNTPEWERQIEQKARENGVPKDSQMLNDASYMVEQYMLTQDLL
ncbi:MAG: hypothetical protein V2A67_08735 [Bacteroidota bacterium]